MAVALKGRGLVYCGIVAVLLLLGMAGCSTLHYDVQVDRDPSMGKYSTFAWHPRGNRVIIVDTRRAAEANERIRTAIERQLAGKGVQWIAQGSPQLLVAFDLGAVKRTEVTEWADTKFQGQATRTAVETREYRQGTLLVYLIDARSNRLVWRGLADVTVEDPNEAAGRIDEIVARLFAQYPQ